MRPFANWRLVLCCAAVVCGALVLAACGGSSDSSSGGAETSSGAETSGESEGGGVAGIPAPVTEAPTEFPIKTPLKETPKPANLTWLACSLPVCQAALSDGYHEAAGVLGWPIKQINYDTLKAADGVQQALNENPDYIAITGIPPVAFEAQAKEAIKKEIPILSGYDTTEPEPEVNGLYYQYGNGPAVGAQGEEIARWIVQDSEGKAKVGTVTIGEYPILTSGIEGIERVFKDCPACELSTISVTSEEVGEGKVANKVVAFLQSNPEVDYIEFTFSDLSTGVGTALEAAGLSSKVTTVGVNANPAVVQEIVDGKQAAWTMQPSKYGDWLTLDVASRLALGMPLEPYEKEGALPTYVVDTKESAEELIKESGGEWPGPEGFEEEFEKIWGL